MRFLIDTQLPLDLARWIRLQGSDVEHVLENGLAQAKDNPIWNYTHQHGLVIVSKDEDFAEWIRTGRIGPQVVWLRIGNASNKALIGWIELRWANIVERLGRGDRLVEVL